MRLLRKAMREGEEVRILRKDLPHLVPWMSSLEQTVADIPEDAPCWDFTVFQPRAEVMVIAKLALSAQWPAWSKKQARAARLVCAECAYDLDEFKDETRLPFDVRLPERPKARRLVCGRCCNDGLDEMERLAALGGPLVTAAELGADRLLVAEMVVPLNDAADPVG